MISLLSTTAPLYEWLVRPITPHEFEQRFFQRDLCVVSRGSPNYYDELLSLETLDEILASGSIQYPDVTLVQSGREISQSEYADGVGKIDPLRTGQLFADGATIIFNQCHTRVPSLTRFCAALADAFSSKIQTNVYLTPQNAEGFKPHFDSHDVFVLQIAGSKHWRIYDAPVTLPLRGEHFDAKREAIGEVKQEFVLQAGDMAYLPRGMVHAAKSSSESSLHITTGLLAFTWADLFVQAVAEAAVADVSLREHLPLGFGRADYPEALKTSLYQEKLTTLWAHMVSSRPFTQLMDEVVSRHRPVVNNMLTQISHLATGLTLRSEIRSRQEWSVSEEDAACVLDCHEKRLRFPKFLTPAVEFLQRTRRCRISEIPDCVDDDGKMTLVKRLIKEGIVECLDVGSH